MRRERDPNNQRHGLQFPAAVRCGRGCHAIAARLSIHDSALRLSLQDWLLERREQFSTFMLEEIADLAVCAGYSRQEVDQCFNRKDRRFM